MKIGQILAGASWGEISPDTLKKGLGGRETAMVKLAEQWAKSGHEVVNFVPIEARKVWREGEGSHAYVPIGTTHTMLANNDWDAVVTWELPSAFKEEAMRKNIRVRVCEMQVAHFAGGDEMQYAEQYCDYVAALSPWAAEFLVHSGLEMPMEKIVILPNGIDISRYPIKKQRRKSDQWTFVYSSSPDRGLWHLLKLWPKIRKLNSKAELYVCYGFSQYVDQMRWTHIRQGEMALEMETLIDQPGVVNVGKIGQGDLAELQLNASAWLYPLDALWPTETGCITAVENAAAGNPLIISDGDCLPYEFGSFSRVIPLPFHADEWANNVAEVMSDDSVYNEMQAAGREFATTRTWERIAPQWLELFAKDPS